MYTHGHVSFQADSVRHLVFKHIKIVLGFQKLCKGLGKIGLLLPGTLFMSHIINHTGHEGHFYQEAII